MNVNWLGDVLAGCLLLLMFSLGMAVGCYKSCATAETTGDLGDKVMAKLNELAAALAELTSQLEKAKGEIVAKVADLTAALDNVDLPAEAESALVALQAKVKELDDLNPDANP